MWSLEIFDGWKCCACFHWGMLRSRNLTRLHWVLLGTSPQASFCRFSHAERTKTTKNNYFTSSYPHHDIYTFCYWQIFWHFIWHILAHNFQNTTNTAVISGTPWWHSYGTWPVYRWFTGIVAIFHSHGSDNPDDTQSHSWYSWVIPQTYVNNVQQTVLNRSWPIPIYIYIYGVYIYMVYIYIWCVYIYMYGEYIYIQLYMILYDIYNHQSNMYQPLSIETVKQ